MATSLPDLSGRTFIVTGANSGLGLATTQALAGHGAHVVMAVRDLDRGRSAASSVAGSVAVRRLDLADLDSVREFAAGIIAGGLGVDVLINNAGIMMPPRTLTKQGFEIQFGTNHLGHFALTGLLLDTLRAGRDARVVTVSSGLHRGGAIHFDDLDGARHYGRVTFYAQSKLANVLFGLELDRRLRAADVPIRSLLAHPGYAATNLQITGPGRLRAAVMRLGNMMFAQDAAAGARSQLHAATAPDVSGGQFYGPSRWRELRGAPTVVQPDRAATDPATARRLWAVSEDLTGVRYPLPVPTG